MMTVAQLCQGTRGHLRQGDPATRILRVTTDSRSATTGDAFIALRGERHDGHAYVTQAVEQGVAGVVIERGRALAIAPHTPVIEVEHTLTALQHLATDWRERNGFRIAGITGSSGKTSTKELVASVLAQGKRVQATRGNLNNHIGVPLTLLELTPETEWGVIEMGMNHRGEIEQLAEIAQPQLGLITTIGTAHLEYLGTQENIALEKSDLIAALPAEGCAVLNADDFWSVRMAHRTSARVVWTGLSERSQVRGKDLVQHRTGIEFTLVCELGEARARVPGLHRVMVSNALLAAGAGLVAGLSLEAIVAGIGAAKLEAQRMQVQPWHNGYIINDAYNANPESMRAALQALRDFPALGRRVAVLGSMGELGQWAAELHTQVGAEAARLNIDVLVTVGPHGDEIAQGACSAGWAGKPLERVADAGAAAEVVEQLSHEGDVVLVKGSRFMKLERVVDRLLASGEAQ